MGFDQSRGDQATVVNVRFDQTVAEEGVAAASPFNLDKNDLLRAGELGVLLIVAALIIVFVARPMLTAAGVSPQAALAGGGVLSAAAPGGAGALALENHGQAQGQTLALPSPVGAKIDIAKIEGQVRVSSVNQVAEFVEKHPEESISILRSWLHEA